MAGSGRLARRAVRAGVAIAGRGIPGHTKAQTTEHRKTEQERGERLTQRALGDAAPRTQLRIEGAYRRAWQAQVLTLITTRLPDDEDALNLVAAMRWRYPRRFVAHLQGDVLPRMKQLTRSFVKYVVSPPMALSRIITSDHTQETVTYWYRDHLSGGTRTVETVDRLTFIGRIVQHILPKGLQRIRYYRLQATCILARMRQKVVAAVQGQCSRSSQDWAHHVGGGVIGSGYEPRCSVIP